MRDILISFKDHARINCLAHLLNNIIRIKSFKVNKKKVHRILRIELGFSIDIKKLGIRVWHICRQATKAIMIIYINKCCVCVGQCTVSILNLLFSELCSIGDRYCKIVEGIAKVLI